MIICYQVGFENEERENDEKIVDGMEVEDIPHSVQLDDDDVCSSKLGEDEVGCETQERENDEKIVDGMEVEDIPHSVQLDDDDVCSSKLGEDEVRCETKEREPSKVYKLLSPEKTKMKIYRGKKSRSRNNHKYYSKLNSLISSYNTN